MASAIDQLDPQQTVAEVGASRSLWQLAWRRFRKNRLGLISAVILVVLYLLAMFAEFLGPYYFDEFHGTRVFAPPQTVHLLTEEGRITRPFTYAYTMELNMTTLARTYTEDRSKRYPIRFFVKGRPYRMFWIFELDRRLLGFDEGGSLFLLGTDSLGRDLLSRILKGAQVSLSVPLIGTLITIILGSVLGVASGYFGGLIDNVIQRFIEVILSFPRIPLWLALSAAVPKTWPSSYVYLSVVVILSLIGWGDWPGWCAARSWPTGGGVRPGRPVGRSQQLADHHPAPDARIVEPHHRGGHAGHTRPDPGGERAELSRGRHHPTDDQLGRAHQGRSAHQRHHQQPPSDDSRIHDHPGRPLLQLPGRRDARRRRPLLHLGEVLRLHDDT